MERWAAAPTHQITSPNFISLVIRRRCQFLSPERQNIREDAYEVGGQGSHLGDEEIDVLETSNDRAPGHTGSASVEARPGSRVQASGPAPSNTSILQPGAQM